MPSIADAGTFKPAKPVDFVGACTFARGRRTEGGTGGALNNAFGFLSFCWMGTAAVVGMFNGVDGGSTAPPFSDAIMFVIVRVAAVAAARLWVGAVIAVLFIADASASGNPIAGVR